MKRTPILSVLLSIAIIIGFLLLFPVEMVLLALLLAFLVTLQVVMVRKRLHPISSRSSPKEPRLHEPSLPRAESFQKKGAGQEVPEESKEGPNLPFDTEIFSKFKSHLETAEKNVPPGDSKPAAKAGSSSLATSANKIIKPPMEEGDEVKLELSPEAKRKGKGVGKLKSRQQKTEPAKAEKAIDQKAETRKKGDETKKAQLNKAFSEMVNEQETLRSESLQQETVPSETQQQESQEEDDIFADLRSDPLKGVGKKASKGKKATAKKKHPAKPAPTTGEDIHDAISGQEEENSTGDEGRIILKMVEDALGKGDRAGAQAGLEQVLALYADKPQSTPWQVRLAQSRLAVLGGDLSSATESFEYIISYFPDLGESAFLDQIGRLVQSLKGQEKEVFRVTLLTKLLNGRRLANDRIAMDRYYGLIEKAQEKAGDEKKLIQYYKNHLEIRKVLEDLEGQLVLIDLIGNRYYKMGDTAQAKEFYELGLKLREEQTTASPSKSPGKDS